MTYTQVLEHYGSQTALARALGISQPTVSLWKGQIPLRYQYQLEVITNRALKVNRALFFQPKS